MSYREPAELCFDDSPLWMLEGPNGAGKSTVFDAITFALYGLHRGGKRDVTELINHERDSFKVVFDFRLGDTVYRIQRTQSKKKSDVRAAILDKNGFEHSIGEANMQTGFKTWLEETIGLDDRTFTTCVMLQQGKSDALLSANPEERRKILTQIVDLSAYESLHKTINDKFKYLRTEAEVLDNRLQGIERVDDNEIDRLRREAEQARQAQADLSAQLEILAVAREKCQEYARKTQELQQVTRELEGAQQLFDSAAQIQSDHERWAELKHALPQLKNAVELSEKLDSCRAQQERFERESALWHDKAQFAQQNVDKLYDEIEQLQSERDNWSQKRDDARAVQFELTSTIYELDNLQDEQKALQVLAAQLAEFAPDFDAQLAAKNEEAQELASLKSALPFLTQFAEAREGWDEMKSAAKRLKKQLETIESQIAQHEAQRAPAQQALQLAEDKSAHAQTDKVQARTWLEQERKHLQLLDEVDNEAQCHYCGHELTPQHIEDERRARTQEVARRLQELETRDVAQKSAQTQLQDARKYLQEVEQQVLAAQNEHSKIQNELENQLRDGRATKRNAQNALDNLPPQFRAHYTPDQEVTGVAEHFNNPYPSAAELRDLREQVRRFGTVEHQLKTLQNQAEERRDLRTRHAPLEESVTRLEQKYPPERARDLREQFSAAQGQAGLAEARLKDVTSQLREREDALKTAASNQQSAERARNAAQQNLVEWRARGEEINARLNDVYRTLEADWLVLARSARADDVSRLETEFSGLSDAPQRLRALNAAQQNNAARLEQQRVLANDLAAMPQEARDDLGAIEAQIQGARAERDRLSEREREWDGERQALEGQRLQRAELVKDHRRVSGEANTHKTLAELLGPARLQRFLLQQAETAIVSNANSVLDKISGGTLQIELRNDNDPTQSSRTAAPKALELLARNTQTGSQPMPVYLLSGSQRFRVAVALALGIGQFAGGGQSGHTQNESGSTRRIESVIIDEGFGSLDAIGRQEIIDELHNLKNVLKRVILVSHQEEFSDRFPTRYRIAIENGTSTAKLVNSS